MPIKTLKKRLNSPSPALKKMVTEGNGKQFIYLLTPELLVDIWHRTINSRVTINVLLMDLCYPQVDQCLAI